MQLTTYSPPWFAPLILVDKHHLDMTATLFQQMYAHTLHSDYNKKKKKNLSEEI